MSNEQVTTEIVERLFAQSEALNVIADSMPNTPITRDEAVLLLVKLRDRVATTLEQTGDVEQHGEALLTNISAAIDVAYQALPVTL